MLNLTWIFSANEQHWNFSTVFVFSNFHQLQRNLMPQNTIISVYFLFMKLLKFCQAGNLKTRHFNSNDLKKFWEDLSLQRNLLSFTDYFLRGLHFRKYIKFARRENKNVSCLSISGQLIRKSFNFLTNLWWLWSICSNVIIQRNAFLFNVWKRP